jgi:hypothetical protein
VAGRPHFLDVRPSPRPLLSWSFSVAIYSLTDQRSYYGMVKFQGKEGFSPFKSLNSSPSPSLLFQRSCSPSPLPWIPSMLYPPLPPQGRSNRWKRHHPPRSCHVLWSQWQMTQKDLDAAKEVTGRAGASSTKMAGRPTNSPGRPAMVSGQSVPCDEGRSPPACQGSPCTRGHGTHPVHALSPRSMIGKEHQSITPTRPTMGILTPRKVTI